MHFFSARRVHVAARLGMVLLALAPAARLAAEEAPAQFSVRLDTSKGPIVVEVHRDWAPHGADRFYELVRSGYYDDARCFRVVAGRWAQFGINGRPEVSVRWRERTIPDDPPTQSNIRGTVAFAFGVAGRRTTQVFINLGDNTRLDREGFAPFGRVVEGMEAADALFAGYGEASGGGIRGGKQAPLFEGGNAWLARHFPRLDFIRHAEVAPATMPQAVEGDYVIRGFRFASGETLPELKLHYRTLGEPRRGDDGHVSNAVLILHGTGGSGRGFLTETFGGRLFGPGQLLDAARYFIVLPDGIGHGGSSKPSDGLHARFPRYNYDDMIVAQHQLLTEGLRVDHVVLVIGTSMGGMHTWLWGERYPDFMDGLVPLASAPAQIAGRNRVMRKMLMDAIHDDPDWKGGDYRVPPRRGLTTALDILMLMTSSPLQWHQTAPTRDAADAFLAEQITRRLATTDANDLLYAFDASRDYDPSPALESIRAPLLAINSADDVVNPPELGLMEKLVARVPRGRYVLLPTGPETRGHGTHSLPDIWGAHLARFIAEIGDEAAPRPR